MGKKSKRKVPINFGNVKKEQKTKAMIEDNYGKAFQFCLDNIETNEDMTKISPFLLHSLLYAIEKRDIVSVDKIYRNNIESLIITGVFDNSKIKQNYQRCKYDETILEILNMIRRKMPNLISDTFDLWLDLCYIFMKYSDKSLTFDKFSSVVQESLSFKSMDFVVSMQLEKVKLIEGKTNEQLRLDISDNISSWEKGHKTYKLEYDYLVSDIWNKQTLKEFAAIYNGILRSWKFPTENFDTNNTKEDFFSNFEYVTPSKNTTGTTELNGLNALSNTSVIPKDNPFMQGKLNTFGPLMMKYIMTGEMNEVISGALGGISTSKEEEVLLKEKWNPLYLSCLKSNVTCDSIRNKFVRYSEDIISEFLNKEGYDVSDVVNLFTKVVWSAEGYINTIENVIALSVYNDLINRTNKETAQDREEVVKGLQETIKELKNNNRTLAKSVKILESDNETDKKKVCSLEKELEILKESVCANEEFVKLETDYKMLQSDIEAEKEVTKKVQQKVDWQEKRIRELEEQLKMYSTIETDMMVLQNENNQILSQVKKIEDLENVEDAEAEYNRKLEAIKSEPIFFVGGTGNLLAKFKDVFVNSDYLDVSESTENFEIPPRFTYVVIYTKQVSHAHCGRVESLVDKSKIIPINICNTKLVVDELYKNIIGHK